MLFPFFFLALSLAGGILMSALSSASLALGIPSMVVCLLCAWIFLLTFRKTKMAYISIVTKDLVSKIAQSKPVSYFAIRKRIVTHNQKVRIKELRSYFATYLNQWPGPC